jgi:hypothetical protein
MNIYLIEELSYSFYYKLLVAIHSSKTDSVFNSFPVNCCEYTCYIFKKYAVEYLHLNRKEVKIIRGRYLNNFHFWLLFYDVELDFTYGQFDKSKKIIIGDKEKLLDMYYDKSYIKFDLSFECHQIPEILNEIYEKIINLTTAST